MLKIMSQDKHTEANWSEQGLPIQKTSHLGQHSMKCTTLMFWCLFGSDFESQKAAGVARSHKVSSLLNSISVEGGTNNGVSFLCSDVLGIACLGGFLEGSKRVLAQAV